jgi:hypothetical protein
VAWESASTTADWWNSGCGYVFRYNEENEHYAAYLGLDGNAYLFRFVNGIYTQLGGSYFGRLEVPAGTARLMLAAQGSKITFFVNDTQVHQRTDASLREGELGWTVFSGTNKDFGTRCEMTHNELWVLD